MSCVIIDDHTPRAIVEKVGRFKIETVHVAELPTAWYVTTTDTFMSGWGLCEDRTNRLYLLCEDLTEAERVQRWIREERDETKGTRIKWGKPDATDGEVLAQLMTREIAGAWYPELDDDEEDVTAS